MEGVAIMVKRIEKEQLGEVQFAPARAPGVTASQVPTRTSLLERAQQLGNMVKHKVFIQFQTTDGPMEVHTTIWDVSREFVGLKRGAAIPIESILDVRF
jgi:hypothetical protein